MSYERFMMLSEQSKVRLCVLAGLKNPRRAEQLAEALLAPAIPISPDQP